MIEKLINPQTVLILVSDLYFFLPLIISFPKIMRSEWTEYFQPSSSNTIIVEEGVSQQVFFPKSLKAGTASHSPSCSPASRQCRDL